MPQLSTSDGAFGWRPSERLTAAAAYFFYPMISTETKRSQSQKLFAQITRRNTRFGRLSCRISMPFSSGLIVNGSEGFSCRTDACTPIEAVMNISLVVCCNSFRRSTCHFGRELASLVTWNTTIQSTFITPSRFSLVERQASVPSRNPLLPSSIPSSAGKFPLAHPNHVRLSAGAVVR